MERDLSNICTLESWGEGVCERVRGLRGMCGSITHGHETSNNSAQQER